MSDKVVELAKTYRSLTLSEQQDFRDQAMAQAPLPPPSDDVRQPLEHLMIGLSVLGSDKDREEASGWKSTFLGSPANVAAIESTASALSKWWATAIAAGGSLAWLTAWFGALGEYWEEAEPGERIAVIAAAAASLAAVVLSISVMVSADIRARGIASAGQYRARAEIANAYIGAFGTQPQATDRLLTVLEDLAAAAAHNKKLNLMTARGTVEVKQCKTEAGKLYVRKDSSEQWTEVRSDALFEMQ